MEEYQRLTHERCSGIKSGYWSQRKKQDLIDRLAMYENTGLSPDEVIRLKGVVDQKRTATV